MVDRTSRIPRPSEESPPKTVARADKVTFTLDAQRIEADVGETVWQVAWRHGVKIPHGCLSLAPDFRPEGNCRLCMIEVAGFHTLQPSCMLKAAEGLVVRTDSERARRARRLVMELLMAEAGIDAGSECGRVAGEMGIATTRFLKSGGRFLRDESHPGIAVELSKCIHCMRCVQACREVEVNNVIGMAGRGRSMRIAFDLGDPMGRSICVGCGSCAQACPTGAISFKAQGNE